MIVFLELEAHPLNLADFEIDSCIKVDQHDKGYGSKYDDSGHILVAIVVVCVILVEVGVND